jgi:hypothetical protein
MLNLIRAVLGIHHHRFNLSVKRSSDAATGMYPKRMADRPRVSMRQNTPWPCSASANAGRPSVTAINDMNARRFVCIETLPCCDCSAL